MSNGNVRGNVGAYQIEFGLGFILCVDGGYDLFLLCGFIVSSKALMGQVRENATFFIYALCRLRLVFVRVFERVSETRSAHLRDVEL